MSSTTTETGLREVVLALAAEIAGGERTSQAITLERPPRVDFGDYSTNAAMQGFPNPWMHSDELYNFKYLNPDIKVLLKIDETSYTGGPSTTCN